MHFSDEKAEEVKTWVVKELAKISDADSDVLGEYVLALIRTDASDEEIKRNSVENLQDFLQDKAKPFVDEIFTKFSGKPLPTPAPIPTFTTPDSIIPTGPSAKAGRGGHANLNTPQNQQRKRSFQEHTSEYGGETHNRNAQRTSKTPRLRGGMAERQNGMLDPRAPFFQPNAPGSTVPYAPDGGLSQMAAGLPAFNSNDPVSVLLMMQSMGFQMPGMAEFMQSTGKRPKKSKQRCIKYDTEGVCILGTSCPFEHGNDQIIAPASGGQVPTQDTRSSANGQDPNSRRGRNGGDRGGGKKGERRKRAEISELGPTSDPTNTTLVIERIPEGSFSEASVREFFGAFGTIIDVKMQQHKRISIVKYDSHEAATAAYNSPKAIFDNRFVKLYWLKTDKGPAGASQPEEPEFDKEAFEQHQAEAQRAYEERIQKLKEAEEQRRALEEQHTELLKRHAEEKAKLMKKIGQDAGDDSVDAANGESEHTKALRAQLAALEEEAKSLGIDPDAPTFDTHHRGRGRGNYAGRGGYRSQGRGRGVIDPESSYYGGPSSRGRGATWRGSGRGAVMRLDNRPKSIAISGVTFDAQKEEALKEYLFGMGEYASVAQNPDREDSQIVTFTERFVAEQLMYGPTTIPGVGKVEFSWVPSSASSAPMPTAKAGPSGDKDEIMDTEDADRLGGMEGDDAHTAYEHAKIHTADGGMDYDVADDEDRWGVGI